MKLTNNMPMVKTAISQYIEKVEDKLDVEVRWLEDSQQMLIVTHYSFPMPTGDGGVYWETEDSQSLLSWNEFNMESMLA